MLSKPESENCVSAYVFHLNGHPVWHFSEVWKDAREKAGLPGKLFHDFRRTAARNMTRAGVSETVAMKITGHKTNSMFKRYNIVDEVDKENALIASQERLARMKQEKNVKRISRIEKK